MKAFIKFELTFFTSPAYMELRESEGCVGEGCLLALIRYLRTCTDGIGHVAALRNIARDCRKSKAYLLHIINDYQIFQMLPHDFFVCEYLQDTFEKCRQQQRPKTVNGSSTEQQPLNDRSTTDQFTPSQVVDNQASSLYIDNSEHIDDIHHIDYPTTAEGKNADADDDKISKKAGQASQVHGEEHRSVGEEHGAALDKGYALDGQKQPDRPPKAMPQATKPNAAAPAAGGGERKAAARSSPEEHAGQEKEILNSLFADEEFMRSLETLTGLCVCRSAATRYYCLQWFRMVRHSQGKPITDMTDAKRHLSALLRKGRQTRQDFHRWHNEQLARGR